jgi:hypothetical protein
MLLLCSPALAQTPPVKITTDEPTSIVVALVGVVVVAAGYGMMLHQDELGHSETGWLIGGAGIVASGVTLTYLGLRSKTVTVAPVVGKNMVGGVLILKMHRVKGKPMPIREEPRRPEHEPRPDQELPPLKPERPIEGDRPDRGPDVHPPSPDQPAVDPVPTAPPPTPPPPANP